MSSNKSTRPGYSDAEMREIFEAVPVTDDVTRYARYAAYTAMLSAQESSKYPLPTVYLSPAMLLASKRKYAPGPLSDIISQLRDELRPAIEAIDLKTFKTLKISGDQKFGYMVSYQLYHAAYSKVLRKYDLAIGNVPKSILKAANRLKAAAK